MRGEITVMTLVYFISALLALGIFIMIAVYFNGGSVHNLATSLGIISR